MSFPKDFLSGASISAFQAEGAKLEDGKGLTVADLRCQEVKKAFIQQTQLSHLTSIIITMKILSS